MKRIFITCLVAIGCSVWCPTTTCGQEESIKDHAVISDITIGINGLYKLGAWAPVRVTLSADAQSLDGTLRILVPDGDGQMSAYESGAYSIGAGQGQQVWTYVKVGRATFPLTAEFVETGGQVHQKTIPNRDVPKPRLSSEGTVISIGRDPDVETALKLRVRPAREQLFHRSIRETSALPNHLLGYAGIDVIMIIASDAEMLAQLNDQQREAIISWTRLGGSLVVTAATDSDQWEGGHPFHSVLPCTVDGIAMQRQTTGIEQFAKATTPVGSLSSQIPIAVISGVDGRVEVSEGLGTRRPAVVRGAVGLGQSVFVGVDLSAGPFAKWQDRPRFVSRLLGLALRGEQADEQLADLDPGVALSLGFDDLVGQLRIALDRFPGVRLVPFSMTASLIALYILLVGPLDYWVLRRWRRTSWTWLTFLSSVVGFTLLAVVLSQLWKGDAMRVNQATIVDIDVPSSTVRGTSWAHVFSPRSEEFELDTAVANQQMASDVRRSVNWHGLPGEGFGGMSSDLKSTALARTYRVQVDTEPSDEAHVFLQDYPIAVWSSRSLISRWWGSLPLKIDTNLREATERQLVGTVPNPFPFELQDVYLMYDRWAYAIGDVRTGMAIKMEGRSIIDTQTLLTRRRVVNGRNVITPWNVENTDVDTILKMMMFYGSSKGRSYTNLRHSQQARIDLSDHLKIGRAVLIGRTKQPAVQITFDGKPVAAESQRNWTYYRLVLPVKPKG